MEEMNPYGHHLGDRDAAEVVRETPGCLHDLLDGLSAEEIDVAPGPGKWSLRELMAHLADCEIVFSWRLRQILAVDHPTLHGFNQDAWARHYAAYSFRQAQATFDALRTWNLLLLSTVTEADGAHTGTHTERGEVTFQSTVENIAGHDLHHIRLIEGLRKRDEKDAVPSPS